MLPLPQSGFNRSTEKHNVDLEKFSDWIEGSVMFSAEGRISMSDIVEVLTEEEVYADQNFALEMVENGRSEINRRYCHMGKHAPFAFGASYLNRTSQWTDQPAYSFCLCISLSSCYHELNAATANNYTEQGELFERLTEESLRAHFPAWETHRTGWSRANAKKLQEVVAETAKILGFDEGEVRKWAPEDANEAGLDVVLFKRFHTMCHSCPVFLVQCASGKNYADKYQTPHAALWGKLIQFSFDPYKAFSTPYIFLDEEIVQDSVQVSGPLLDRSRLLAAVTLQEKWLPIDLAKELIKWTRSRVELLNNLT